MKHETPFTSGDTGRAWWSGVKDPPCRAWLGKYDPSRQQQSLRATPLSLNVLEPTPQRRTLHHQTKVLCAATKAWHSQVTNLKNKNKKVVKTS